MNNQNSNDLKEIITRALEEMKFEAGDSFDLQKVNLAELGHRTNISRKKLRKIKEDGFIIKPHGLLGTKKQETVLSGFTGTIDAMLQQGISNTEKKVLTIDRKNCLPSSEKTIRYNKFRKIIKR